MNAFARIDAQVAQARTEIAETTEALQALGPDGPVADRAALLARRAVAVRALRVRARVA